MEIFILIAKYIFVNGVEQANDSSFMVFAIGIK